MTARTLTLVCLTLSLLVGCGGASRSQSSSTSADARSEGVGLAFTSPLDTTSPWSRVGAPGRDPRALVHNYLAELAPSLRSCAGANPIDLPVQFETDALGRITGFSSTISDTELLPTLNCLVHPFATHPVRQVPATATLAAAPGPLSVRVTLRLRP